MNMNLLQFLLIVRGRWRLGLKIFVGVVAIVVLATVLMPKKYTASALVVADSNKADPLAAAGGGSMDQQQQIAYMATQVGIINSDRVVKAVAKKYEGDTTFNFQQKWEKATHSRLSQLSPSGPTFTDWFAKRLRDALKVAPTGDSSVIEISIKWSDAAAAAALANAFAQTYIDTNVDLRVAPAKQYAGWFDEQSRELRADLQAKQQRLSDFQNESGILPTDERLDIESARLGELSTQLSAIQAQRQDSQSRQSGSGDSTPEILQSQLIATLKGELATAEAKQQNIETSLGKNHPAYKSNAAEIDSLRARIANESHNIVASLGDTTRVNMRREADISAALEAQKKRVLELKHARDQAALLQNDVATAQRNLDAVTQRLAQSTLEGAARQSSVVLLSPAAVPDESSSPSLGLNAVLGLFFGMVLGFGTVLLREMSDRRVRAGEELEQLLGVPLLGRIAAVGPRGLLSGPATPALMHLKS
jgi:succinoglycan biosynthesis transport protein ExoP